MIIKHIDMINFLREKNGGLGWTLARLAAEIGVTRPAILKWEKRQKVPKDREDQVAKLFSSARYTEILGFGEGEPTSPKEVMQRISASGFPIRDFRRYFPVALDLAQKMYSDPSSVEMFAGEYVLGVFRRIKAEYGVSHDLFDIFLKNQYNQNQSEQTNSVLTGDNSPF
jgi:transcriptional regulator with XRE-family HTH domain